MRKHRNWVALAAVCVGLLTGCGNPEGLNFLRENEPDPLAGERLSIFSPLVGPTLERPSTATIPPATINKRWPVSWHTSDNAANTQADAESTTGHLSLPQLLDFQWSRRLVLFDRSDRRPMLAQPVVADGVIYVLDIHYRLHALSLENGSQQWRASLAQHVDDNREDTEVNSRPLALHDGISSYYNGAIYLHNDTLYVTTGWESLLAVDRHSGQVQWSTRLDSPSRSPAIVVGDRVIVKTVFGSVQAFSVDDGSPIWVSLLSVGRLRLLEASRVTEYQGRIVAPFANGELSALDSQTGAVLWRQIVLRGSRGNSVGELADFSASPVALSDQIIAGNNSGLLVALSPDTGTPQWQLDLGAPRTPWPAGNLLFVTTNNGQLVAINRSNGEVLWFQELPKTKRGRAQLWHAPVLAGGRLLLLAHEGAILEVSPIDGSILDSRYIQTLFHSPPVVVDGRLILLDAFSHIRVYGSASKKSPPQRERP